MIVLDSFAVLALLKGEPAAEQVRSLLERDGCRLTVLGIAEVLDHLVRVIGVPEDEAVLDLAQLGLADPPPLDAVLALRAGLLRARHYHRTRRAVGLADCVAAETARSLRTALATSDPHLLDLAHDEQIDVRALPDSAGNTWTP